MSPVAETKRITDLFLLMGEDQSLLTAFERDPRSVLDAFGLDQDAIEIVLTGDREALGAAVEEEITRDPLHRHLAVLPRMGMEIAPWRRKRGPAAPASPPPLEVDDEPPRIDEPQKADEPPTVDQPEEAGS